MTCQLALGAARSARYPLHLRHGGIDPASRFRPGAGDRPRQIPPAGSGSRPWLDFGGLPGHGDAPRCARLLADALNALFEEPEAIETKHGGQGGGGAGLTPFGHRVIAHRSGVIEEKAQAAIAADLAALAATPTPAPPAATRVACCRATPPTNAEAYQRLMGRWSGLLARGADRLRRAPTRATGCSMSAAAPAALRCRSPPGRSPPRSPASTSPHPHIAYAAARSADPRLDFRVPGDAVALDLPAGQLRPHAVAIGAGLHVRSFARNRRTAAGDPPRRRRRRGGRQLPGGLVYQRIFWDTARPALDPAADAARARHYSSPLTGFLGQPAAAFRGAGLRRHRRRLADDPHRIPAISPTTGSRSRTLKGLLGATMSRALRLTGSPPWFRRCGAPT